MLTKLNLLLFLSFFIFCYTSQSDEIWIKVKQYINESKMILNDKNYFIFDEENYTNLDLKGSEMQSLYEKQKEFYSNYSTANYIFVIKNLNEKQESIEDATYNLCRYLYNEYGVSMEKSVVALFSIETKRVRIRTGEKTKEEITDGECEEIINDLGPLLREKKYFEVWITLIEKFDYFINESSSMSVIGYIVLGFFYLILIIIWVLMVVYVFVGGFYMIKFLIQCIKECIKENKKKKNSLPNNDELKKIVRFLKNQKSNKKIFTDNCIICLENFENKNTITLDIDNNDIKSDKLMEHNENDISVLNCGHQFHINCIAKWLKKNNKCPICRQIADPELKEDNNKVVWRVQTVLHPSFRKIEYDYLYTRDFYVPPPTHSSSSFSGGGGNYNFGGGFDCGGGATGGW